MIKSAAAERICAEGRNCWRIARARRAALLIDGAAYFEAFAAAAGRARRSILIAGWDIDGRLRLLRNGRDDGLPVELGARLNAVVSRRPALHAHVLGWDFAVIYALDRQPMPLYNLGWKTHRRFHFALDGNHPLGASHHQKIVVIDDALAFVGGLDLSKSRWDTPEHRADDPRRINPGSDAYPPYHDVQMALDGEVAAALGDLVRQRWRRATGEAIDPPEPVDGDPWPPGLGPDFEDVDIAVSRTEPNFAGRPEIREVEALFLDSIRSARRFLYIENQYLTSSIIGDALAQRLEERDGPEIIIVVPRETPGWLEENTMGILRRRLLGRLSAADRFQRLRVYCPAIPDLKEGCLHVHAKVMVADDRLLRVGSANLNNRSMGLDTECDVAIEPLGEARIENGIARLKNRLLGEHLGTDAEEVAAAISREGSLIKAVERLRRGRRTLEPLPSDTSDLIQEIVPDSAVIDPERPIEPDKMIEQFAYSEEPDSQARVSAGSIAIILGLAALAAAWHWTPLADSIKIQTLTAWARSLEGSATAPLLVIGAYLAGGFVMFPVTFLIVATVFAFGPALGFAYALGGSLASAVTTYGAGRLLGRDIVRRLAGRHLGRLHRLTSRHGLPALALVRMLPLAPFSMVNMVAGATRVGFRDFTLGSAIGLTPGILALTVFEHQLEAALRSPSLDNAVLLAVVVGAIVAAVWWLRRWATKKR